MGQNAGYLKQINVIPSFIQFFLKKLFNKKKELFNKRLEFDFFDLIQNCHVHEPSQLVENLQHLHITTEKNLTSKHSLKLKSLGFGVLKYIALTFC